MGVREGSGGWLEFDDLGGGRGFCFSHAGRQDVQLGGHGPSGRGEASDLCTLNPATTRVTARSFRSGAHRDGEGMSLQG